MEKSLIISFLASVMANFGEFYKNSCLKSFIDKLYNGFQYCKARSIIVSTLSSESKLGERWKQSKFFGAVSIPLGFARKLLNNIFVKLQSQISSSRVVAAIDIFIQNLFNYSIRSYGIFFCALFSIELVLWVAFKVNEPRDLAIRAGLLLVSGVMILLDISLASLFQSSYLFRFVKQGFVDGAVHCIEDKAARKIKLQYLIAAGAALGVLCYFLSLKLVMIAAAGFVLFAAILKYYELGVFIAAGFAALMPTTAMYGIMLLTIASFIIRWALGRLPKYAATPIDGLIILFFIVLCYSTITSYFIRDSIGVLLIHSLMLVFYFTVTRTINSRYKLYLLIALLVVSASLTSLYGVYQYYGGAASTEAWVDTTMFQDIQSRVGSTFNNPNILGEYLILMIPLCLALLWYKKNLAYKTIFIAMLGLMGVCMIFTFSRGAWLGLIMAMVGFFIVRDKRLFILLLIALFIMPFVLPPSVMNRFTSIGNLEDTSSSYRMSILMGSLRMVQDFWLTGIGLGSEAFKAIYPRYSLAAAYAHHSHNIYLQVALEMGIAGAAVFLLLILIFVRATLAHQGKTKDRFLSSVMIAACTGIAGYLVQGLVENIWYNYRVLQTFWVVLAIGLCALNIARSEVQTDD